MAKNTTPVKVSKWKKSTIKKVEKWKKVKKNTELVTSWRGKGWIAEVVESEDGDGWAVEMRREGDDLPVYVAPWTMGRNKVDPKPLSLNAFNTWVKSASEFLMRSQYQNKTTNRTSLDIHTDDGEVITVIFDIQRGEYQSTGVLIANNHFGDEIARVNIGTSFVLTVESATDWIQNDFEPPPQTHEPLPSQDPDSQDPDSQDPDEYSSGDDLEYVDYYDDAGGYEEPVYEYD